MREQVALTEWSWVVRTLFCSGDSAKCISNKFPTISLKNHIHCRSINYKLVCFMRRHRQHTHTIYSSKSHCNCNMNWTHFIWIMLDETNKQYLKIQVVVIWVVQFDNQIYKEKKQHQQPPEWFCFSLSVHNKLKQLNGSHFNISMFTIR